ANTPGFSTRRSQSQMIGVVSRALSKSGGVGVVETVAAPRTLDDPLKDAIRKAYTTLQANTPGFSTRRSQSQMIGVVSRALSKSGGVGVV
ncbi:hypothetical protein C7E12_20710, partial [Stenotrophomonas maltophilia]